MDDIANTDITKEMMQMPTETLIRAAIIHGICMAGEIAAAIDRIAAAQERQAEAQERLAQSDEDRL